jgi:hypothetical protein
MISKPNQQFCADRIVNISITLYLALLFVETFYLFFCGRPAHRSHIILCLTGLLRSPAV